LLAGPEATPSTRPPKAPEIVAEHIRNLIIRGKLAEGDYVPPEAQLATHYATSRPTIREAMRILENERLVSIVSGSHAGAQVRRPTGENVARLAGFVLQANGTTLADLYEARLGIEPLAAGLAAERRTPAMVEQLRTQFRIVDELGNSENFTAYGLEVAHFHQSIVDCSGNQTLQLISSLLQGVFERHQLLFRKGAPLNERLLGSKLSYEEGMQSLEMIINLIEAQDRNGAETHWRRHLEHGNATWLSGYDGKAIVDVIG
jgi:DNA-binding FadR family transcriptional regulator